MTRPLGPRSARPTVAPRSRRAGPIRLQARHRTGVRQSSMGDGGGRGDSCSVPCTHYKRKVNRSPLFGLDRDLRPEWCQPTTRSYVLEDFVLTVRRLRHTSRTR